MLFAAVERKRERRMAQLDKVGITKVGIEVIEGIDAERDGLAASVADD